MRHGQYLLIVLVLAVASPANAGFLPPPGASVAESTLQRWTAAYDDAPLARGEHAPLQQPAYLNSLVLERSPYLLQHATNPVNWVSWSESKLAAGRSGSRLIFLSIGYSTCHWCHVMNRESFSDPRIAELINANFIAIKIDREELPVVDRHYSNILAIVKGSAGWPLTAVLDSGGNVILIDSYLDPAALTRTLTRIVELERARPEALEQSARFIASLVAPAGRDGMDDAGPLTLAELARIGNTVVAGMDPLHGGIAGQQKFPNEPLLAFLLALEARQSSDELRAAIARQLGAMVTQGLYDPVNGGFFRYSTERTWRNPHYEKMLYNQAQLLGIYSEAYGQYGNPFYKWLIGDLARFLEDWLYAPGQGYLSAIDAETDGVEGGFYLWDDARLGRLPADAAEAAGLVAYPARGKEPLQGILLENLQSSAALEVRRILRRESGGNRRPFIDTKIITSWNAALISGMAAAQEHVSNNEAVDALQGLTSLGERLWTDRYDAGKAQLYRTRYNGERAIPAPLEDYAFLLGMLIDLYDVSADKAWLERADTLARTLLAEFLDDDGGMRPASSGAMSGIARQSVQLYDAELPAADAVALGALWRLAVRRGDARLRRTLETSVARLRENFRAEPYARLYAGRVLADIDLGSIATRQYFAAGNGRVEVTTAAGRAGPNSACDTVTVAVKLADGWHVNSSEPLQDYLRPTAVSVATPDEQAISVVYPAGRISKLGFQEDALSVYDGEFAIDVASDDCSGWSAGAELTIDLQACTDEICLLPDVLRVRLPRATQSFTPAEG